MMQQRSHHVGGRHAHQVEDAGEKGLRSAVKAQPRQAQRLRHFAVQYAARFVGRMEGCRQLISVKSYVMGFVGVGDLLQQFMQLLRFTQKVQLKFVGEQGEVGGGVCLGIKAGFDPFTENAGTPHMRILGFPIYPGYLLWSWLMGTAQ